MKSRFPRGKYLLTLSDLLIYEEDQASSTGLTRIS